MPSRGLYGKGHAPAGLSRRPVVYPTMVMGFWVPLQVQPDPLKKKQPRAQRASKRKLDLALFELPLELKEEKKGTLDRLHGSRSLEVACRGMMFLSNFKLNKRKGIKRSKGLWQANPLWHWEETCENSMKNSTLNSRKLKLSGRLGRRPMCHGHLGEPTHVDTSYFYSKPLPPHPLLCHCLPMISPPSSSHHAFLPTLIFTSSHAIG